MARGRILAKSLSTSRRYADLHAIAGPLAEFCQSMYPLLVAHSDDFGRLSGDVFTIKHVVVPTSPRPETDLTTALTALNRAHLICWYSAKGRKWIQIQQFDEHQTGLHKRTISAIPPPPRGKVPESPGNSGSRARAEQNRTEQKGREQKGTEGNEQKRTEGKRTPRARARNRRSAAASSSPFKRSTGPDVRAAVRTRPGGTPTRPADGRHRVEGTNQGARKPDRMARPDDARGLSSDRRGLTRESASSSAKRAAADDTRRADNGTGPASGPATDDVDRVRPSGNDVPDDVRERLRKLKDSFGSESAGLQSGGGSRRRSRHG